MDDMLNTTPATHNLDTISLSTVVDIAALEAEFNTLNASFIEASEACHTDEPQTGIEMRACADWVDASDARDAFLTQLAETSSTDPEVTRFKARVYAAVWHENHRDGLTHWMEAALEPHEEDIDLSDAMARSIARDVFDQATGPLLVSQRDSVFTDEEMLAARATGQGRAAPMAMA